MRAIIVYYHKYNWMKKGTEMKDLALAAGYDVRAELEFKKLHKMNYMTDIKYDELDYLMEEHKVKYVLMNEPISVRYMRKLEEHFDDDEIIIVDKTMLILEIFERKASFSEIQLQIKLAKIKYTEPRMRTVVGETLRTEKQARDRGAGETMQQIMKSDMRGRVARIEKQVRELMELKSQEVDNSIPKIPIMGYYSIGKTTLFNILTSSNREISQEAFTTMFLKSSWTKVTGYPIELIDTIGLVDLPPAVIDAFSLMLQSIFSSNLLILGLDASAEGNQFRDQLDSLIEYYNKFSSVEKKYKILFVLTKCDLIGEDQYFEYSKLIDERIENELILSYEILGVRYDKPELMKKSFVKIIDMMLEEELMEFEFKELNQSEASKVYNHARVTGEIWKDGLLNVTGIIPKASFYKNLASLKDKLQGPFIDEIPFD